MGRGGGESPNTKTESKKPTKNSVKWFLSPSNVIEHFLLTRTTLFQKCSFKVLSESYTRSAYLQNCYNVSSFSRILPTAKIKFNFSPDTKRLDSSDIISRFWPPFSKNLKASWGLPISFSALNIFSPELCYGKLIADKMKEIFDGPITLFFYTR